ncbi:MAG: LysM peptidoglycan-binding domain-containing protein [Deltaproteobacteria bacterium]|nr:LysM peptidoglycan-binding domain-containing protein [Deltaproteobacteria bacterium]
MRSSGATIALVALLASVARADQVTQELPLTTDARARSAIAGEAIEPDGAASESEELRILREWESRTFGPLGAGSRRPELPAELAFPPRLDELRRQEDQPDALTSRTPPLPEGRAAGSPSDAAWLQGLQMPDLPFRWDENVLYYLDFWKNDPRGHAIMAGWLRRIGRYGPMIRRILRAERLPEDLLYVAMIESSFDPSARSPVGAMGLWQLMPRGGEVYGLAQNHWIDERRDPERSTRAAAAFLSDLYRRFGTWDLALAGYHMGYAALLKAIRKYNSNDYWALARMEAGLPYETTYYVPKILAAALVGRNPERFGLDQVQLDAERGADVVELPASCDFGTLARAVGCGRDEIAELNPHLLRGRTPPVQGVYRARIPAGKRATFEAALSRLRPELRRYGRYVPRFGDTLEIIARRHRVTRRALAELNGLAEDARVPAELVLVVPAVPQLAPDPSAEEPPVATVPAQRFTYTGRRRVFYTVVPGDTASAVAAFFGASAEELRQWNAIEPEARLQPGMVLQLFVPTRVDLTRAVVLTERQVRVLVQGTDEFFDYHERLRGRRRIRYTVREGDTLQSIGQRFELSVGSLARINRVERNAALEAGRTLIVYAPARLATAPENAGSPVAAPPSGAPAEPRPPEAPPGAAPVPEPEPAASQPPDAPPGAAPPSPPAAAPSSEGDAAPGE